MDHANCVTSVSSGVWPSVVNLSVFLVLQVCIFQYYKIIMISYALSLKYVELTHLCSKCGERLCFVTPVLLKYFVSNILAKIIFAVSVMD
jgi:hypothetical protein